MENDKLVRLSDAISAILADKISGQQLEIIRALGSGIQAETLNQACDRHAQYIRDLPAVDAVEVVHSWWEDCSNGWSCGKCHYDTSKEYPYCPWCGARMDGNPRGR